ncbi:flagellar hook-associated protein FlgK [Vogesella sp. LIG4]|uniref:flagellar hook-associated protein FlgK n=1 Tax=Vogesella sp. LIG4 TaxID=1192162 RepID=UPI00081FFEF8|nr:flagellar hook-associated protein FlgK [Vogesella sp. LIG4]SCK30292.1 flagellar hook-associated protein 1 FlgK [Vogesella sp. LIG4]
MNLLSLGASGLAASRVNLDTTSHNISNVNTEGYSRQVVSQQANLPLYSGFGYLGQGVSISSVSRMFDQFTEDQLRTSNANISSLQAQKNSLGTIDNMLTDSKTGIMASVQDFFTAMQTAAANPTSIATRQVVLSQGQALVDRFQTTNTQIEEMRQSLRSTVQANVQQINTLAGNIANINKQITILSGNGSAANTPNDLLDQRDKMVQDLSKLINVSVVQSNDGNYNVILDNGSSLVVGTQAGSLATQSTQSSINVFFNAVDIGNQVNGQSVPIVYSDLRGGELQGNLQLLGQDIPRVQIDLGNLAVEFTDAVNRQHELGVDLTGSYEPAPTQNYLDPVANTGPYVAQAGGLFQDLSAERTQAEQATSITQEALAMQLAVAHMAVKVGNPAQLAMSSGVVAVAGTNPDGSLVQPQITGVWQEAYLHQDNATPFVGKEANARLVDVLPAPSTGLPNAGSIQIPFNATTNPVFGTPTVTVPGFTCTAVTKSTTQQGVWEFEMTSPTNQTVKLAFKAENMPLSGTQTLTIQARNPATDGVNGMDNNNMLAMNQMQSQPILASTKTSSTSLYPKITDPGFTRTSTMEVFFAQTVSYVGTRGSITNTQLSAQQNLNVEINAKKQSLSGVSLDEEASNLVKFQQAYQASSKVIQMAQDTFKTLLDAIS